MELTATQQKRISMVLEKFDYARVKKVIDVLEVQWVDYDTDEHYLPNIENIKSLARFLLLNIDKHRTLCVESGVITADDDTFTMCSGGLEALVCSGGNYTLQFVAASTFSMECEDSVGAEDHVVDLTGMF